MRSISWSAKFEPKTLMSSVSCVAWTCCASRSMSQCVVGSEPEVHAVIGDDVPVVDLAARRASSACRPSGTRVVGAAAAAQVRQPVPGRVMKPLLEDVVGIILVIREGGGWTGPRIAIAAVVAGEEELARPVDPAFRADAAAVAIAVLHGSPPGRCCSPKGRSPPGTYARPNCSANRTAGIARSDGRRGRGFPIARPRRCRSAGGR